MNRSELRNKLVELLSLLPLNDTLLGVALHARMVRQFVSGDAGDQFGLDAAARRRLVHRFQKINQSIPSATQWPYYIVIAEKLLRIPKSVSGNVVECGCYKGASTAALSILCSITGRKLYVCDSFQGLPEDDAVAQHNYPHLGVRTRYKKGSFCGRLEEVKANVEVLGDVSCCEFVKGYFCDTLPTLNETFVLGFFDVDLATSMRDCIKNLWPRFSDNAVIFTDDSCDIEVVKLWFERELWAQIGCNPPGYIGSGCGLPGVSSKYSSLGYVPKIKAELNMHDFAVSE